jgi:hypothetical protein
MARQEVAREALRKARKDLPRQRSLNAEMTKMETQKADLRGLAGWLERAEGVLRWLAACPVCGEGPTEKFDARDIGFEATCPECETRWGIAALQCGHRVPFCGELGEVAEGHEAVEELGRDVLALRRGERWGCPWC